jgi:heme/copper-type cytochrome/quinol oxidase subunit 4
VLSSILTIILFFYSYTGAFAVEFLALDIFSSLLAIAVGQCLAYHIYKYSKPAKSVSIIAFLIVIVLLIMFVVFTYKAPHVPLFLDKNTGTYGV